MKSSYSFLQKMWKKPKANLRDVLRQRFIDWRQQNTVERIEKPSRLNRARELGYKAKLGFVLARVRITKGGRRRRLYGRRGRKPSKSGLVKFTHDKGLQWIAEERAAKHYPNLEVLNSYLAGDEGVNKYFEIIMVDPQQGSIKKDKNMKWIATPANRRRVHRGLTSAGKKARGLKQ